ncbi:hypothetical protein [Streptomyces sp. MH60]|uniref:hypothetical protein n=1 Tax=Streptomyces sp. MH60 TaxID=1940758 RepID=UPI000CEDC011|nr:hypothetical protein [Streptomyces sp. MH60]PPS89433.1 hypothetical protein BZZ08_01579 [Streptomyces sp. MH60]
MTRFLIGLVAGAACGGIAYAASDNTLLAVIVGAGVALAVWARLFDLIADGIGAAMIWAMNGGESD